MQRSWIAFGHTVFMAFFSAVLSSVITMPNSPPPINGLKSCSPKIALQFTVYHYSLCMSASAMYTAVLAS